jgi:hypothetical protein
MPNAVSGFEGRQRRAERAGDSGQVDVAPVGAREPQFVELNGGFQAEGAARIDLAVLHDRYVR